MLVVENFSYFYRFSNLWLSDGRSGVDCGSGLR